MRSLLARCTIGILAAVLVAAPVAAVEDDWRPGPPDRLALMDAAMAPVLTGWVETFAAVNADLEVMLAYVILQDPDSMVAHFETRLKYARMFRDDIAAMQALAVRGLDVLALFPPEDCWRQYWAVLMTGWLLAGDAVDSVQINDYQTGGVQVGNANYLLTTYGDLVHQAALADCA